MLDCGPHAGREVLELQVPCRFCILANGVFRAGTDYIPLKSFVSCN